MDWPQETYRRGASGLSRLIVVCAIDLCVLSSVDVFRHFPKVAVVIGEKDGTLDRESMKISAESGCTNSTGVSILDTTGTNHLVSLEQPEILRALVH